MKFITTGRDGKEKLSRRDGTVYIFLLDGTGRRCIYFFTTGRDGTFFLHDGKGRYAYFFNAQESAMQEHTAPGTKAAVVVT